MTKRKKVKKVAKKLRLLKNKNFYQIEIPFPDVYRKTGFFVSVNLVLLF